jgi:hypothetical protein
VCGGEKGAGGVCEMGVGWASLRLCRRGAGTKPATWAEGSSFGYSPLRKGLEGGGVGRTRLSRRSWKVGPCHMAHVRGQTLEGRYGPGGPPYPASVDGLPIPHPASVDGLPGRAGRAPGRPCHRFLVHLARARDPPDQSGPEQPAPWIGILNRPPSSNMSRHPIRFRRGFDQPEADGMEPPASIRACPLLPA